MGPPVGVIFRYLNLFSEGMLSFIIDELETCLVANRYSTLAKIDNLNIKKITDMIQLHTTKKLHEDLTKSGCAVPETDGKTEGWHWYAHRITLMRKKCVIVMEEECRYALIFFGLKKGDFANFEQVLTSRIIAEATWLCDLPDPGKNKILIEKVQQKCNEIFFDRKSNRSVQAHIRQVAEELEYLVLFIDEKLPELAEEEIHLGLKINDRLRKRQQDKDYFMPIKSWRKSLLTLISAQRGAKIYNLDDFRKK